MKPFPTLLALTLSATLAATTFALKPGEQTFARSIQQRLDQATANLKLAKQAAGPEGSTPSASAINLALLRYDSAADQLKTVQEALKKIPADDPITIKIAAQTAQLDTEIQAFNKRLGADPAPTPDTTGTKLDYKQAQLLKDTQYRLREIEGDANALDKVLEQVKAAKDPDLLDHQLLADAVATIAHAQDRKKLADTYLAQLPTDGADVPATKKSLDSALARIDAANTTLTPIHARLQKIIDPATYPALAEDTARIQHLSSMFSDPALLESNPPRAAEIYKQSPAAAAELERILKLYALFLQQKPDAAKTLGSSTKFLQEKLAAYLAAAATRAKALPAEIDADLKKSLSLATEAVTDKKPLFFTGGIPQYLTAAQTKLTLLTAIDPVAAAPFAKSLADTRADLKQKQASLRDLIIAENPLPPDRYTASDKADYAHRASAAWLQIEPAAKILTVRIPSENWERETYWQKQNATWYLTDRSKLQAQLIVQRDDKTAVIRPINLYIDHVDNNKFSALPMDDLKDELQPADILLLNKIK